MEDPKINRWLLPISSLYGLGVQWRNALYSWGVLKSHRFPIPIICVGNIAVGGTGKSPCIEYIIREFYEDYRIAVVSRGYRRHTKGLRVATSSSSCKEIGDEPALLARKYPRITMVVDEKRKRAIDYLLQLPEDQRPQVILMDDGFQHRSVRPSYTILLGTYARPIVKDKLLPAGRLREFASARHRADMVVITKCPPLVTAMDFRLFRRELELFPHQEILFSEIKYGAIYPLFPTATEFSSVFEPSMSIMAICGIANPHYFASHIKGRFARSHVLSYSDHHPFGRRDIRDWENILSRELAQGNTCLFICTEKDAVKLMDAEAYISEELRQRIYVLPVEMRLRNDSSDEEVTPLKDATTIFVSDIRQHIKEFAYTSLDENQE